MTRTTRPRPTVRATRLRRVMPEAEACLWEQLRDRRLVCRFRRQHPVGPFVVDFVCLEHRVVVECDGSQHHASACDRGRDRWLVRRGFLIMRFWNNEVLGDMETVLDTIATHIP